MEPLYTCLWFNDQAEEASSFYTSVFRDMTIISANPVATVLESFDQRFVCLNGYSQSINPSISIYVVCTDEPEIDFIWEALSKEGKSMMPLGSYEWSNRYGWVEDKFGVSWQLTLGQLADTGQKYTPSLMFTGEQTGRALEAVDFYCRIFPNSGLVFSVPYPAGQQDEGLVMHAQFRLNGKLFMAMDSSVMHGFQFNEAVSFVVECPDQATIDHYWDGLKDGGKEQSCGWLKDKFGVAWQVIPQVLGSLMADPERSGRVMQAFLKMKKFDIQELLDA